MFVVFNVGSYIDLSFEIYNKYENFDICLLSCECGIKIEFENLFELVFVDGEIIIGIYEYIFLVICDILFIC